MVGKPRILFAENFDSYSHIIVENLCTLGAALDIMLPQEVAGLETLASYDGVVLSPGPGNPSSMPHLSHLIHLNLERQKPLPLLGICLGHQALGYFFGAKVTTSAQPTHGKISHVRQASAEPLVFPSILAALPKVFPAVRYHSLILADLPPIVVATGTSATGEIMAIQHRNFPFYGVQFHPEAHLTHGGAAIFKAWLQLLGIFAELQASTAPTCKPILTKSAIFSSY